MRPNAQDTAPAMHTTARAMNAPEYPNPSATAPNAIGPSNALPITNILSALVNAPAWLGVDETSTAPRTTGMNPAAVKPNRAASPSTSTTSHVPVANAVTALARAISTPMTARTVLWVIKRPDNAAQNNWPAIPVTWDNVKARPAAERVRPRSRTR